MASVANTLQSLHSGLFVNCDKMQQWDSLRYYEGLNPEKVRHTMIYTLSNVHAGQLRRLLHSWRVIRISMISYQVQACKTLDFRRLSSALSITPAQAQSSTIIMVFMQNAEPLKIPSQNIHLSNYRVIRGSDFVKYSVIHLQRLRKLERDLLFPRDIVVA